MLEGRVLMDTTSSKTSSFIAMASTMAMDSHYSNGGNFTMLSR
jgi:hypothetical protein